MAQVAQLRRLPGMVGFLDLRHGSFSAGAVSETDGKWLPVGLKLLPVRQRQQAARRRGSTSRQQAGSHPGHRDRLDLAAVSTPKQAD